MEPGRGADVRGRGETGFCRMLRAERATERKSAADGRDGMCGKRRSRSPVQKVEAGSGEAGRRPRQDRQGAEMAHGAARFRVEGKGGPERCRAREGGDWLCPSARSLI